MEAVVRELFSLGLYKRNQGRIARQATFAALALIVVLGAWSLSAYFSGKDDVWRYYVPMALVAIGLWASFRVVQIPAFADFLISVEAEMNKVSWPSWTELIRSSIVVILMIFMLAGILFFYVFAWKFLIERVLNLK